MEFKWLQENGAISDQDMMRIFNCGIGLVVIMNKSQKERALQQIRNSNFKAFEIGNIVKRAELEVEFL